MLFNLVPGSFSRFNTLKKIKIKIGKNNWDFWLDLT
jgi:hypothetical protein